MSANFNEILLASQTAAGTILALNPTVNIGGIPVQTVLEEAHTSALEVTEHPVASGADITDHSYVRPVELRLSCGWSNSGLLAAGALNVGAAAAGASLLGAVGGAGALTNALNLFGTASSVTSLISGGALTAATYVDGIYSQLRSLQQARQPISVQTGLLRYDNMLITELVVRRDQRTQNALMVEASLKQIIIVSTVAALLPTQGSQANPASTAASQSVGSVSLQSASPAPGGSLPVPTEQSLF